MRPQAFLFPLQIAVLQRRYVVGEGGSRRLEVRLSDGAVLSVESFGHPKGWDALATLRRAGAEVSAGGHAAHSGRLMAEAGALALLAECCDVPRLPVSLRQALAHRFKTTREPK